MGFCGNFEALFCGFVAVIAYITLVTLETHCNFSIAYKGGKAKAFDIWLLVSYMSA